MNGLVFLIHVLDLVVEVTLHLKDREASVDHLNTRDDAGVDLTSEVGLVGTLLDMLHKEELKYLEVIWACFKVLLV
jgi:hypothetical protein